MALGWLLATSLVLLAPGGTQADGVEIIYLGNEGFLLVAGEQKVLIDALFGDGLRGYPVVPRALRRPLEAAEGRYAGVDLVLASHVHPDHFAAAAVARHLQVNPGARFVSTEQAARQLRDAGVAAGRVTGWWPPDGERRMLEHAGIRVTGLRLHHGDSPAQNLGLLIEIGGVRVLHMGDTEITAAELRQLALDKAGIDVALVPYWFFASPHFSSGLDEIGARHRVAMHFPTADAPVSYFEGRGDLQDQIALCRKRDPEVWTAIEPGDSRRFEAASRHPKESTP